MERIVLKHHLCAKIMIENLSNYLLTALILHYHQHRHPFLIFPLALFHSLSYCTLGRKSDPESTWNVPLHCVIGILGVDGMIIWTCPFLTLLVLTFWWWCLVPIVKGVILIFQYFLCFFYCTPSLYMASTGFVVVGVCTAVGKCVAAPDQNELGWNYGGIAVEEEKYLL